MIYKLNYTTHHPLELPVFKPTLFIVNISGNGHFIICFVLFITMYKISFSIYTLYSFDFDCVTIFGNLKLNIFFRPKPIILKANALYLIEINSEISKFILPLS